VIVSKPQFDVETMPLPSTPAFCFWLFAGPPPYYCATGCNMNLYQFCGLFIQDWVYMVGGSFSFFFTVECFFGELRSTPPSGLLDLTMT